MNITNYSRIARQAAAIITTLTLLFWVGCSKPTGVEAAIKSASETLGGTWNALKGASFDNRSTLVDTLSKATDGLSDKARDWASKLSSLSGDSRTSAQSALSDLNGAVSDIRGKLGNVNGASAASWEDIKTSLMAAWQKAQAAYLKLTSIFASSVTK